MSNQVAAKGDDAPIETRAQLIGVFERGSRPAADWRIGTEHEKFVYKLDDHRAPVLRRAGRHPRPAEGHGGVRLGAGDRGRTMSSR